MIKRKIFIILLIIWCSALRADEIDWTVYTEENSGLGCNYVFVIAHDKLQNVWFATYDGLYLFDGQHWTTYDTTNCDIISNRVNAMAIDSNDVKWLGFTANIKCGISSFDDQNWKNYYKAENQLYPTTVMTIAVDRENKKWFGQYGAGLTSFDENSWHFYHPFTSEIGWGTILCMVPDSKNKLWVCTSDVGDAVCAGVNILDGENWSQIDKSNSDLVSNSVYAMAIDKNGVKWFGTNKGVCSFDGEHWQTFDSGNSDLISNNVVTIAVDSANRKWFGTYNHGLMQFNENNWTLYNTANSPLPGNEIQHISADKKGNIWVATDKGVATTATSVSVKNKIPDSSVFFKLFPNYPNPFNNQTCITYNLQTRSIIKIQIFDILGKNIMTLIDNMQSPGSHKIYWNGKDSSRNSVPSGLYFVKFYINNTEQQIQKIMLIK